MIRKFIGLKRKIKNKYHYLLTRPNKNIYHCCIQKSASTWFAEFWSDPAIWRYTHLAVYTPRQNFVPREPEILEELKLIPSGVIVSPLYIRYEDFKEMTKPMEYRAFYVIRDPRDLVISDYFSLKYSHPTTHPYIVQMRKKLNKIPQSEGIMERIENFSEGYFDVLRGWLYSKENDKIRLFRFEDLFGANQKESFQRLFDHCNIDLPQNILTSLLNKYSFENISSRKIGSEDKTNHYRKGIKGDWKHYFSENHKVAFKKMAGSLLIDLGYETDCYW